MKIVNTNSAVSTASINTPLARLVSALSVVRTFKGVGKITLTKKLAKMLPVICAVIIVQKRVAVMALVRSMAKETAGLKRPPLMRKKIQTLTMSEKAKISATYCVTMGEKPVDAEVVVLGVGEEESMLATWVPEKAKKRNIVVPTNSPMKATKSMGKVSISAI
jgi:hypothetical protein